MGGERETIVIWLFLGLVLFFLHGELSLLRLFFFFFFFLNYYGIVCGDSKLLEKTVSCTKRVSTFDQGQILNLDLW